MVKLADLVNRVKVGFVGSINEFYCDAKGGVPLIRTTDLNELGIDYSNLKYVTKEFHEKNRKSQVKYGDVIIARHGDNGKANVFKEQFSAQVLNAVIIEPRQEQLSSDIIKILFDTPFLKKQILGVVKGSVQGVINTSHIADLLIPLNARVDYKRISKVITNLDAKIELNNRINAELEAMAKMLYDYWFVQFDFPNAKGKPYKSSGGKMVYNAELKRQIPEGWEVRRLNDAANLIKDQALPKDVSEDTPYIGLEHIPRKSIVLSEWETAIKVDSAKSLFKKHDILFGKIRPYFHKVGVSLTSGITSTDTIVLRPKSPELHGIVLQTVFSDEFVNAATQSSTGSKMPRADWEILKAYPIVMPPPKILKSFQDFSHKAILAIENNVHENHSLASLRDWLLPMLMNGQVKVA